MTQAARLQLCFLIPISMFTAAAGAYFGIYWLMSAGILLVPVWFVFADARRTRKQ